MTKLSTQVPAIKLSALTTFLNPYSYQLARNNIETFSKFENIYFDGSALCHLMKLIGVKQKRISFDMTSLAPIIFRYASAERKTAYFIGGEQGVANEAARIINLAFPDLNISGCRSGFFKDKEEEDRAITEILSSSPDIVICGMGTPYQEKFILKLKEAGWVGLGFTCGGFFHQTAKSGLTYYPYWFNKLNLRWAYRIIDEPKLIKRYALHYPKFLAIFMLDVIFYKKHRHFIRKNTLINTIQANHETPNTESH